MKRRICLWATILGLLGINLAQGQVLVKSTKEASYSNIQISPDSHHLLATSIPKLDSEGVANATNAGVYLFDLKKNEKHGLFTILGKNTAGSVPVCVAFSSNGNELFAGGDCMFGAWSFPARENRFLQKGCPLAGKRFTVDGLTSPRRGDKLAYALHRSTLEPTSQSVLYECKLIVWNLKASLEDEISIIKHDKFGLAVAMAFADSGNLLAHWNSETKEVTIHNTQTIPKELAVLELKLPSISKMAFAPDEQTLWLADSKLEKWKLEQWDFTKKKKLRSLEMKASTPWFHPLADNSRLLIFEESEKENGFPTICFLDFKKETEKRMKLEKAIFTVTLSPDETLLAGCSLEGGIYLWNVSDLAKRAK